MRATFVELPAFYRLRDQYLNDDSFKALQNMLMANPEAGEVIQGTGGLRKTRFPDQRRGKGKRGGLRVIYFWNGAASQFWLFTLYDKDQADDLTSQQRELLKQRLQFEMKARGRKT